MTDGRTIWMPKDAGWWRREHIVELGEEFGTVGPAVLDWLSLEAKMQNDAGRVKSGPKAVARGVFSDAVTVSHVLSRAVRIGALHDYDEHDGRFTCLISGWDKDNRRGWDSFRKADSRAKNGAAVTDSHDESRPVTEVPQREEKRKGLTSSDVSPVRASRRVDQGQAPDDLPAELAERLPDVLGVLAALQAQRGGNEPTLRGAALALQAYPDRDHLAVARELEHWAIAGGGQRREIRDWVRQYRSFLDRAAPGAPTRREGRVVGNHLQRHPADDRVADLMRQAEEARAQEAAA